MLKTVIGSNKAARHVGYWFGISLILGIVTVSIGSYSIVHAEETPVADQTKSNTMMPRQQEYTSPEITVRLEIHGERHAKKLFALLDYLVDQLEDSTHVLKRNISRTQVSYDLITRSTISAVLAACKTVPHDGDTRFIVNGYQGNLIKMEIR